ncbi:putative membrane protein [Afipia carboxidovorans OM5]|uniref:Putative transmembran protein n=1 Tax=Afipia carboxidovorans (strain ATCC 49405 / DSM 1227 / KCTC 32145 / OM5) TaxID=504832 RepID=B6JEP4_AFIC5|nr:Nramp family divalent metal transporter [Afipia carboxidovorans]ACI92766.1 putative membrane protein [Afipia carboxidovorans OM5]AEI03487.1 putative transmembran protein [Afipia carboxidovorans OM4]AEI07064.1 putative transmembran protein [Afipia carboxidovorans OM5]
MVDQTSSNIATEISSKNLPPVTYRDLPEPLPFKQVVGPSVILLAGAIGSGEYVLWPYITTQTGMALVWLATIGILTQYFLNMEITRYTLATGETAITGFTRLWKPWGFLFIFMVVIPWMWPGWATGSSTAITYTFGLSEAAVVPITIASLVLIGIVLTVSPVVYKTVEKIQFFLVGLIVLFMIYTVFGLLTGKSWSALFAGFTTEIPNMPAAMTSIPVALLLGAIAFAGAGGSLNLAQSNWVRDKGLGMGAHLPKIVSPITGDETRSGAIGYFFPQDEKNLARWRGWWNVADREQFITFFVLGLLAILLFMALAFTYVGVGSKAQNFDFVRLLGENLSAQVSPWVGAAFWGTGVVVLMSTNLAVIDMVSRLVADIIKTNWTRDSKTWTESRVYFIVAWLMIAFGSIILLTGVKQPLLLLIIASALNGLVMFVYSVLLIQLNRGMLPRSIGLGGVRYVACLWAVLFYGGFSIYLVVTQFGKLF